MPEDDYIPLYVHVHQGVHVHPGYREKSADLQGTLKLHMQLYNRMLRLQRSHNEKWHAHCSLRAHSMATYASISQRQFTRDLGMCVFLASVARPS